MPSGYLIACAGRKGRRVIDSRPNRCPCCSQKRASWPGFSKPAGNGEEWDTDYRDGKRKSRVPLTRRWSTHLQKGESRAKKDGKFCAQVEQ